MVFVGRDPVTGRKRYVSRTVRGNRKDAESVRNEMLVDVQRGARPHPPPRRSASWSTPGSRRRRRSRAGMLRSLGSGSCASMSMMNIGTRSDPVPAGQVHSSSRNAVGRWTLGRERSWDDDRSMAVGRKAVARVGLAAIGYACWLRPRLMRWGATDEEVTGPYPGAGARSRW